jgi:hypothetical protein
MTWRDDGMMLQYKEPSDQPFFSGMLLKGENIPSADGFFMRTVETENSRNSNTLRSELKKLPDEDKPFGTG